MSEHPRLFSAEHAGSRVAPELPLPNQKKSGDRDVEACERSINRACSLLEIEASTQKQCCVRAQKSVA